TSAAPAPLEACCELKEWAALRPLAFQKQGLKQNGDRHGIEGDRTSVSRQGGRTGRASRRESARSDLRQQPAPAADLGGRPRTAKAHPGRPVPYADLRHQSGRQNAPWAAALLPSLSSACISYHCTLTWP